MTSELKRIAEAAGALGDASSQFVPDLHGRAVRFSDRLRGGRFHVVVLGEFKRGKSTLINALLRRDVLPTGVLPLTTVQTEVAFGEPGAQVVFEAGARRAVAFDEVADFVTERHNPANRLGVARLEITVPSALLASGLVLVDSPGISSIHEHNTDVALAALEDADGAILVLGADAPFSEAERDLVSRLRDREMRLFVVLNKVDHLRPTEVDSVRDFVTEGVEQVLDRPTRVWCIAARPIMDALRACEGSTAATGEFADFEWALSHFVVTELVGERIAAGRRELSSLAHELQEAVELRQRLLELETLGQLTNEFRAAASRQRAAFDEDRLMLVHASQALIDEMAAMLSEFAAAAARRQVAGLRATAESLDRPRLETGLLDRVDELVRSEFEPFRRDLVRELAKRWSALATDFRERTQGRVNEVRRAAANLFLIELPDVAIPSVVERPERFFYLFVRVGSVNEDVARLGRRALPTGLMRRRLLRKARAALVSQFDKQAGRMRWDLVQRVESARTEFEQLMLTEVDRTIESIHEAAERAAALHAASEGERNDARRAMDEARRVANQAIAVAMEQG